MGGLAAQAVPVLGEHHRDAAAPHQIPHPVETGAHEGSAALPRVDDLRDHLKARAQGVRPQRLELLGEGKAVSRLLFRGHPGVEHGGDDLTRAIHSRRVHFPRSDASRPRRYRRRAIPIPSPAW